jgi:transposase InsO family protein
MKNFFLFGKESGNTRRMLRIQSIEGHPYQDLIENRMKAIWLLERGRMEEIEMVFGYSRSSVYTWRRRWKASGEDILSLVPYSRAPHRRRERKVRPELIEFIRKRRIELPGLGKETIKGELDRFCGTRGLKSLSESSVGRIIADLKRYNRLPGKGLRHKVTSGDGRLTVIKTKKKRKKERRGNYQPKKPGDLVQIDSMHLLRDGVHRYLITGIDLCTRFGFAFCYKTLNSLNAADFFEKFKQLAPFKITHIQTDNGSEFEKHFLVPIRDSTVKHFNSYPRHPQSNAYVERFNRTLRYQFFNHYDDDIDDPAWVNRHLVEYLLWYNIEKPHRGINKLSPLEYYMKTTRSDFSQSRMLWTPTGTCQFFGDGE